VDLLARAMARFGKSVRAGIERAQSLGDADTADIFTEISRGIDKQLWFVEAHQQK
jgi:starvation-inducible DNA-binding protein